MLRGCVLEAQMLSMRPKALLFCSTDSPNIVLHSKNLFGGVEAASKKF